MTPSGQEDGYDRWGAARQRSMDLSDRRVSTMLIGGGEQGDVIPFGDLVLRCEPEPPNWIVYKQDNEGSGLIWVDTLNAEAFGSARELRAFLEKYVTDPEAEPPTAEEQSASLGFR